MIHNTIYNKLKTKKDKNRSFFSKYKWIYNFGFYGSYVMNILSVVFAFLHVKKVIGKAFLDSSDIIVILILALSFGVIAGLETLKRFLFDRFSDEMVSNKNKGIEVFILGIFSLLLFASSFYLSVNGAKEFAAKKDEIKDRTEMSIQAQEDSISAYYESKIIKHDSIISSLMAKKDDYNEKSEDALTSRDKKYYRDQIKETQILIDKTEVKIKELKAERDNEIKIKKNKIENKAQEKIESNDTNSIYFLLFSSFIECLILFGVYFSHYYNERTLNEYETLIEKDPRHKTNRQYNLIIDQIYTPDVKVGDSIPYKAELTKMMKLSNIDMSPKELEDSLKILTHLKILQKKGPKKCLKMDEASARETIKKYLKIE